jgi:hypothetical protein
MLWVVALSPAAVCAGNFLFIVVAALAIVTIWFGVTFPILSTIFWSLFVVWDIWYLVHRTLLRHELYGDWKWYAPLDKKRVQAFKMKLAQEKAREVADLKDNQRRWEKLDMGEEPLVKFNDE